MCILPADNESANGIPSPLLTRLSEAVEQRLGLHFPPNNLKDLERKIVAAAGELGFADAAACAEWLLSSPVSPERIETLAGHLTVAETYFFRDRRIFDILQDHVLPECVGIRQERERYLRLWSAGCATGEEPYSLAILLARLLPRLKDWHITLLATDVSPVSLNKAAEGVYGEWSFRDSPVWLKDTFFERIDRMYRIAPRIREMVTFSRLNMVQDFYPAILNNTNAMDLIFCRNVLMYFSRRHAGAVVHNLCRCLAEGGWLVLSPVEIPGLDLPPQLRPVHFPGAVLYRKETETKRCTGSPAVLPPAVAVTPASPVRAKTADRPHQRAPVRLPAKPEPEPARPEPDADRVRLRANEGRLAEALALCEQAIQADKLNPSLHYLQATILEEVGRPDEAAAALQRTLYIDQNFVMAHFALGHLLQRSGRVREAGKHLGKAASLLKSYGLEDIPPEAAGMNAARLIELIEAIRDGVTRR